MSNKSVSVDPRHGPIVEILMGEGPEDSRAGTARRILTALDALPVATAPVAPVTMAESETQRVAQQLACDLSYALGTPPQAPVLANSAAARVAVWLRPLAPIAKEIIASRDEARGRCDELQRELDATKAGLGSALNLRAAFLATAEVREARALRNYAGEKLERALLSEQIASAISRGHLSSDFYVQLREWSK